MTQGPVVGPFDNNAIIAATAYTLSQNGGALASPPGSIGDNRKTLVFTAATAVTVTVPPGLNIGFQCDLIQAGAGLVTLVAASGVTIHSFSGGLAMDGINSVARLTSTGQDTYVLSGTGL